MVKSSKYCTNCKSEVKSSDTYCYNCGKRLKNKRRKTDKKLIILIIIGIIILPAIIIGKDKIIINYYLFRANNEKSITDSINYYSKALDISYRPDIVFKIGERLKEDKNIDDTIKLLELVLEERDLNKISSDAYVKMAEESFEDKKLDDMVKYLKKAVEHNFDIKRFKYYDSIENLEDLLNENYDLEINNEDKISEEDSEKEFDESANKETLNDDEYFIEDSNTRYLTKEELSNYSKEELPFIRNEIFARQGYIFSNEKYNNYFKTKKWYNPNPNFSGNPSELSTIEYANVKLIQSLE